MIVIDRKKKDDHDTPPTPPPGITEIELVYFKATPASLHPFGATTLSWELQHSSQATIFLNHAGSNSVVHGTGSIVIHPPSNTTYYLIAVFGEWERTLGTVDITVDTSHCTMAAYHDVYQLVTNILETSAAQIIGINFRNSPQENTHVTITDGNIHFHLEMSYDAENIPDPQVDINCDFGFTVIPDSIRPGRHYLEAVLKKLSVSADLTTSGWIEVGLEGPAALIAANLAIDSAKKAGKDKTPVLVDLITKRLAFTTTAPHDTSIENAVLRAGTDGLGVLTTTYCPVPPLINH